ncbi:MAG: hypothetical protein F4X65_02390 [Chloroflexi bacterium]|nr:hypothetical protein [Chloroflexota bacterium]
MGEPRIFEIGTELLRLSRDGKLEWKQGYRSNEYDVFVLELLATVSWHDDARYFRLKLSDDTGRVIASMERRPSAFDPIPDPGRPPDLEELYRLAEGYVEKGSLERTLQYLKQS